MKTIVLLMLVFSAVLAVNGQTVTDIEGNVYNTVSIGTQVWMKENLRATKYNDGTSIPSFPGIGIDCGWYNNDSVGNGIVYGALYGWSAVDTAFNGGKNICPSGWHVPTDAEWITLTDYLGGESVAGGKLKEAGTEHWESPNIGATNESGFTALPGGCEVCNMDVTSCAGYANLGVCGYWWSSTEDCPAWSLSSETGILYSCHTTSQEPFPAMLLSCSVRCLMDNIVSLISPENSKEVTVYPNPVSKQLSIDFAMTNAGKIYIELFDISGKVAYFKSFENTAIQTFTIDLSSLAEGIYFVRIQNADYTLTKKVIKVE